MGCVRSRRLGSCSRPSARRLKKAGDDADALRLLARASVRLGRDESALAVFGRLGPAAMTPDDKCLLGIALTRTGNARGVEVWEQVLAEQPNHAETLFVLTETYYRRDRLDAAAMTGRRLARLRGWEGRAEALLGAIELAQNDPEAALRSWRGILGGKQVEKEAGPPPIVPPMDVARALLQTHQPRKARSYLETALASKPEPEGFWLLSRAFLQEGTKDEALGALEKSGSFRDENPLAPEPSPYVGSNRCAVCHSAIFQSQQALEARPYVLSGRGAWTSYRFPRNRSQILRKPKVTHSLRRSARPQG